jgi:hypothetical protein
MPQPNSLEELKQEWFARLSRANSLCRALPPTGLQCLTHCPTNCCPRIQMRAMRPEQRPCSVLVFLPFEMEYVIEKTGISRNSFRRWPVTMANGLLIDVGMFDLGKPCPFLASGLRCGIYEDRPVDCYSFPLLPILGPHGRLTWKYEQRCPSLPTLNPAFEDPAQRIWAELFEALPRGWWALYHEAGHWTGWPRPYDLTQINGRGTLPTESRDGQVGPDGVVIREVVGVDSPHLPTAIDLLEKIFPEYEQYAADLRLCALQRSPAHPATLDHLWVVEREGAPIGLRLFHYIFTRNLGHGAFIGLLEPYRDRGICSWLVEETLTQLCIDARHFGQPEPLGYVIEVEPIEGAHDEADRLVRERRIAFHLKNNAFLLDVDYVEPPMIQGLDFSAEAELAGVHPESMQLAFYPTHPGIRLSQTELINVVESLYIDYYRLQPDSWFVRRAVDSILAPNKIELEVIE